LTARQSSGRTYLHKCHRYRIAILLLAAGCMACDASVAGIDGVDAGHIERLARITSRSLTPVENGLLDAFRQLQSDRFPPTLPQLQTLFDLVLEGEAAHSAEAAAELRRQYSDATARAWADIDGGRTGPGQRGLFEARALEVRLTTEAMGPTAVRAYVALLGAAVNRLEDEPVGRVNGPHDHLIATARNLVADARMLVADGDMPGAIDVATHAAGLLNTILPRN